MAGTRDPNQVVQQIQGFLRSNNQELTQELRELSREYAEWGRHAADRLRRCEEYLHKGLRSEAVHHALLDPQLLELTGILQFPQYQQWDELVTLYNLPVTPLNAVAPETLAELNHAFAEEEILANDMRQYRRLVLEHASLLERAEKLRTLLLLEPEHQGLQDNLREIESAQITEILDQIRRADRANKPEEVGRLYQIIARTAWLHPPSGVIVEEIQRVFHKYHVRIVDDSIKTLAERIVAAHGRHDAGTLTHLLTEWDQLADTAGLTPGDRRARPVESARLWVQRVHAEQDLRLQHEMAVAELGTGVATLTDIKRLWTLYERVQSFKGRLPRGIVLLPPDLEHRFEDATSRLEKSADFNRLIILIATISLGVVALVGFLVFIMTR